MKHGSKTTAQAEEIPLVISIRTKPFMAELRNWRRGNRQVPWRALLTDALEGHFAKQQKEKAA